MISREEIAGFYDIYGKELFVYIYRYAGTHEPAEDMLQDTFVRLIAYSEKKDISSDNIRALLYSIARSVCIDYSRKKKFRRETVLDEGAEQNIPDPHTNGDNPLDEFIEDYLMRSKEPGKTILLLRRQGKTFEFIAEATGIPLRTVKRRAAEVLEDLRCRLRSAGFLRDNGMNSGSGTL